MSREIVPYVKKCCFAVVFLLMFVRIDAFGQNAFPAPKFLGIDQGLSNNNVNVIFQDKTGFIWIGTYDGLNRYDGYEFKIFRKRFSDPTSLIHNTVYAISEDCSKHIWIGTLNGVSCFDEKSEIFSGFHYLTSSGSVKKITFPVRSIDCDKSGNMYFKPDGSGFYFASKGSKVAVYRNLLYNGHIIRKYTVSSMTMNSDGRLFMLIEGIGLALYDNKCHLSRVIDTRFRGVSSITHDRDGNLYFCQNGEVIRCDSHKNITRLSLEGCSAINVTTMCMTSQHLLWIATDGKGIHVLNTLTGQWEKSLPRSVNAYLGSNSTFSLCQDRSGKVWVGSLRGGVCAFDNRPSSFYLYAHNPGNSNSLINNFVLSFAQDSLGNIWTGTDGGGLSCWDQKKDHFINFRHSPVQLGSLSSDFVTKIVADKNKRFIWISTWGGGIDRYDLISHKFHHYPFKGHSSSFFSLFMDSKGRLWAGSCNRGSLYLYNASADIFSPISHKIGNIISISEDPWGNIWCGTFEDLIKVDITGNDCSIHYPIGFSVRAMCWDGPYLWLGTEGGGLLHFNPSNGVYNRYTEQNGLSNNSVLNLLMDSNRNIWYSTFSGLGYYSVQKNTFRNFSSSDGLPCNQFNYNASLRDVSGNFYFGSIKGFCKFNPSAVSSASESRQPQVVLTDVRLNDKTSTDRLSGDINGSDIPVLTVPYGQDVVSFSFSALEYTAPDKIRYAYRLEGWDNNWILSGKERTASYAQIETGTYMLHIRCTNAQGMWNPVEKLVLVKILPPWYKTWWFLLLCFLLVVSLVFLFYRHQARRRQIELELKLSKASSNMEKAMNEHKLELFTNIAHDLRAPLDLVISPVKEWLFQGKENIPSRDMNIIYMNAKRLSDLVNQLLLLRKNESDSDGLRVTMLNLSDVLREVFLCFIQQASQKKLEYAYHTPEKEISLYADDRRLETILFNLLSFTINTVPEFSKIDLDLSESEDFINLVISVNGKRLSYFTQEELFSSKGNTRFGMELYIAKQYVESFKGSIAYRMDSSEKSLWILNFKKGFRHYAKEQISVDAIRKNSRQSIKIAVENPLNFSSKPVVKTSSTSLTDTRIIKLDEVDRKNILIIEPAPFHVASILSNSINDHYNIWKAAGTQQAWPLIKEYKPDLILCDILLDNVSGIEFCMQIKNDESYMDIPIVLLTESNSPEIKLKALECGADDCLSRYGDDQILFARIRSFFMNRDKLRTSFYNKTVSGVSTNLINGDDKTFIENCEQHIENHITDEEFCAKSLCLEMRMSHSSLYKRIKELTGLSLAAFIRNVRIRKAASYFIDTSLNVNEVAFRVGIMDVRYFRECFTKFYGMTPSAYRKKYHNVFQKKYNLKSIKCALEKIPEKNTELD